ncbi:MAG: hypothetical protein K0R54_6181 [Clostridiaceae bacterium]|nr:hypothetical protein [Clostridiaceae bacterium]
MLSLEEKIMGLSLIWKEAEYNFPFWSKIKFLKLILFLNIILNYRDLFRYYATVILELHFHEKLLIQPEDSRLI